MYLSRVFTPQELLTLDGPSALLQAPEEKKEGKKDADDDKVIRHGHTLDDMKNQYVPNDAEDVMKQDYETIMRQPSYVNNKVAEDNASDNPNEADI
jgi:hypothetical protein